MRFILVPLEKKFHAMRIQGASGQLRRASGQCAVPRGGQVHGALAPESYARVCRVPGPQECAQAGRAQGEGGGSSVTSPQSGQQFVFVSYTGRFDTDTGKNCECFL
jgi:hypothetical protein